MAAQPPKVSQHLAGLIGLSEVFFFTGTGMLAYGASQVYGPAGWIVAGAIFAWLGYRK